MSKSKSNDQVNLTKDQLEVTIPEAATACFEDGAAGHRTLFEKMLEGTEITIKDHLAKVSRDWNIISHRSKQKLMTKIFEQVREILKVGEAGSLGPAPGTFDSYRTRISRCMIYHVSLENSHLNNKGLSVAFENALAMTGGGDLKSRMEKALEECIKDPDWAGNPPTDTASGGGKDSPNHGDQIVRPRPMMPQPGTEDSPAQLVYWFFLTVSQGGGQNGLRNILRDSDDPRFQKAYKMYLEATDMLGDFTEEERGEKATKKSPPKATAA